MQAINFVVRDGAGNVSRGEFGEAGVGSTLAVAPGQDVSLNISKASIEKYVRDGDNLIIFLTGDDPIVLEGFFNAGESRLYLSEGGVLENVVLTQGDDSELYALYEDSAAWGKWSPDDDLIFSARPEVAPGGVEAAQAAIFGGGLSGGGLAGAAALIGGATLLGGGGGGGGGGGSTATTTTQSWPVTVNEDAYVLGGDDMPDPTFTVSGTGAPGSVVEITVGDEVITTTTDDGGNWVAEFGGDTLPADGDYTAKVIYTENGISQTLEGPTVFIDTTAPLVEFGSGVQGTGDSFNAEAHANGVTISGTAEAGATLTVTVGGVSETINVGDDGTWSLDLTGDRAPTGEYESEITIKAVDGIGNSATYTETLVVDTVGEVGFNTVTFGGDTTINAAEMAQGFSLSGTTQPGSSVTVTYDTYAWPAVVAADGSWTVDISGGELPGGEYDATFTATSTDSFGNTATATQTHTIDTVTEVTLDGGYAGADGVITASEVSGFINFSGTTQPGAIVSVNIDGTDYPAVTNAQGIWTLQINGADLREGAYTSDITVTATDQAGNTATTTGALNVDTTGFVEFSNAPVTIDDVVNAAEADGPITISGTTQPGSSVTLTMAGQSYPAVVAGGSWTATLPAGSFPPGEYEMPISASATSSVGNTSSASSSVTVDTQGFVTISGAPVTSDDVVNAAEAAQGITLTGTTEPGSTVQVSLDGALVAATVDANGNWSAQFSDAQIPDGETTATVSVTATDAAGNVSSATDVLAIDTVTNVDINLNTVEGDGVINAVEASDGVLLSGTAQPGSRVEVTMAGVVRPAIVAGDGSWQVAFQAADIPTGETTAAVTVTATDAAGNQASSGGSIPVDTLVRNLTLDTPIETDGVINAVEAADGVTLTGTVEPGSTVEVGFGSVSHDAQVDAFGNWRVTFSSRDIDPGEYNGQVTITATDPAGNVETLNHGVEVDTIVNPLTITAGAEGGDDIANAEEAADGLTLTGTVERGSSVNVMFEGTTRAATVGNDGSWTVTFDASEVPAGEYSSNVSVMATDAAGNTRTESTTLAVDTQNPDAPVIQSFSRGGEGIRDIGTTMNDDITEVQQLSSNGQVSTVSYRLEEDDFYNELVFRFDEAIDPGNNLVVTSTDDAGNQAGTLFVLDGSTADMANAGLDAFDIQAVDLQFAEDSTLEISADQLRDLSDFTNELTVHGGNDDTVIATGARATGESRIIEGQSYDVYTLGEGTLVINDDINVQTF